MRLPDRPSCKMRPDRLAATGRAFPVAPRLRALLAILFVLLVPGTGLAESLAECTTSVRGTVQDYIYDAESPALKDSRSMQQKLLGRYGQVTCPGLVTLRVLTPELTDADRAPFCLQWDRREKTYLGYAEGARDGWLGCKRPARSFCERVNGSKAAAVTLAAKAAGYAIGAGIKSAVSPGGALVMQGPAAAISGKLLELGAVAASGVSAPVALGAVAVTAVAVGGAV